MLIKQSIIVAGALVNLIDLARGTVTFLFVLFVIAFLFAAFGRF